MRLYNGPLAALFFFFSGGCGSDADPLPDTDRALETLDEAEIARVCDEIEHVTIEDPAYAWGPCTALAAESAAQEEGLSCTEVRDACIDSFPRAARAYRSCPLPREPYRSECGATQVGEVLTCMRAVKADVIARFARASCSAPGAVEIEPPAERSRRLLTMPLAGCEALVRECPPWFEMLDAMP